MFIGIFLVTFVSMFQNLVIPVLYTVWLYYVTKVWHVRCTPAVEPLSCFSAGLADERYCRPHILGGGNLCLDKYVAFCALFYIA